MTKQTQITDVTVTFSEKEYEFVLKALSSLSTLKKHRPFQMELYFKLKNAQNG